MSTCYGCKSEYMPSGQTWDNRHRYRPSNYNPFLVPTTIPYGGPDGLPPRPVPSGYYVNNSKENFYASSSSSWTPCGNVTAANSPGYGTYLSNNLGEDCASMGLRPPKDCGKKDLIANGKCCPRKVR